LGELRAALREWSSAEMTESTKADPKVNLTVGLLVPLMV